MRTIWKGHIKFSLVNIPVRLYSAVDAAKTIDFDWLTKEGNHPVGYTKTDKTTGEPLEMEDIVKGYEYEPDQYVVIPDEDIEKVKPESTRAIKIQGFISNTETHPTLYDKPYFIGPESESDVDTYRLFTKALKKTEKTAVGKVVLRNKESPVLLTPYEGGILMYKLRYPNQLRNMDDVPYLKDEEVDEEQLEMAVELIDKMTKDFSDIEMEDHYYETMKDMIENKIEGNEVVSVEGEGEAAEPRDIMEALKASIEDSENGHESNGQKAKYEEMTKDELYDRAKEADIEGRSDMDKGELIKALEALSKK